MSEQTVEQRLQALEADNDSRKVAKKIAGSLVSFVAQTSDVYEANASSNASATLKIKFVPNSTQNGKSMTNLRAIVSKNSDFSTTWPLMNSYNLVQTGDGSVINYTQIFTMADSATFYVKVVATGASEGVFSQI